MANAAGSVTVGRATPEGTKGQPWDPNHANDKTPVVISADDGGATPTPTATTSSSPTATATTSATPTTTATSGATANGGLAATGSSAGMLALGGAVLVAAGGGLVLAFRRKSATGTHA